MKHIKIFVAAAMLASCTTTFVPDDAPQKPSNPFAGSYQTTTVGDTNVRMYVSNTGTLQMVLPDYSFKLIVAGTLVVAPPHTAIITNDGDSLLFYDFTRVGDSLHTLATDSTNLMWFKYL